MNEIFKDIPGFEGLYQVSNYGRILSLNNYHRKNPKILKPYSNSRGYLSVVLAKKGEKYPWRINRLVAMTFLPNPQNLPQVNHKDENKANNRVDNLEWCSPKYNMNYGTRGYRTGQILRKPVACFDLYHNLIKQYPGITDAAKDGHNRSGIIRAAKGQRNTYHGYIWEYC